MLKRRYLKSVSFMIVLILSSHLVFANAESLFAFQFVFDNNCGIVLSDFENGVYGEKMYCLSSNSWGYREEIIIHTKDNKATIIHRQGRERYKRRGLSAAEFQTFQTFIAEKKIDSLLDTDFNAFDGIEYQYMHVTNDKKVTFYMNNPNYDKTPEYQLLVKEFTDLANTGDFEVYYSGEMNHTKVLVRKEDYHVQSVWKKGDDFRILVKDDGKLHWRKFANNIVGDIVSEPGGITMQDVWGDIPESKHVQSGNGSGLSGFEFDGYQNNYPWMVGWNSYCVRSLRQYGTMISGLWLTRKGEEPKLVKEGAYFSPVVIPDTDWVVCSKAGRGWADPNSIVKINLKTCEEVELKIKPADTLTPIVCFDHKILIARHEKNSNEYERYLYDISTEKIEKSNGSFDGLFDVKERFLQETSNPNVFYATQERNYNDPVVVGKIDVKNLTFTKIAEFEGIDFNSMNMWVDEVNHKLYVVKNGDLLELLLNETK